MTRIIFLSYVCSVQLFNPFNITIMKTNKLTFETAAAVLFGSVIIGGFVAVVFTLLF